jgi:HPt (histidine-containing phosphotransfer) domain-containing protein
MDSDDSILVGIDRDFMSIVPEYLENRQAECAVIELLLEDGNMDEILALAHRLKGSGGSCGFDEISKIGETMEVAARAHDAVGIVAAINRLKVYLSRVTVEYV